MTHRRQLVAVVWLAFVLRAFYYCVHQPMWEGLDEWAHFAAVEFFAEHGRMPARADLVSDQVVRSLELAPLPWSNNGWVAGAVNHDDFWRLPAEERATRRAELWKLNASYRRPATLPPAIQRQYEAQQPPLYYAALAPVWWLARSWPLPAQVLWLRIWNLSLASATIPLAYGIARRIPAARGAAVEVAALVAAMPAVTLHIARVGNDPLAMTLITFAVWTLIARRGLHHSAALGFALLAKAYALALIPVFAAGAIRNRRTLAALALALAIAGWWYAGNLAGTGTLAGDQMDVASHTGITAKFAAIPRMQWGRIADTAAMTHIWIGGWSFLLLRSWMYRVWEGIALIGAAGVVLLLLRRRRRSIFGPTGLLAAALASFLAAVAWFAVLTFAAMNLSAGVGWYLLAMCAAEATLLACGFTALLGARRARVAMAATVMLAIALDLYTLHWVLGPYYAGLIRHRPNSAIEAFHLSSLARIGVAEYVHRLDQLAPGLALASWAGYLAGTIALAVAVSVHLRHQRLHVEHDDHGVARRSAG